VQVPAIAHRDNSFAHFDVSRNLETWKFPASLLMGLNRLCSVNVLNGAKGLNALDGLAVNLELWKSEPLNCRQTPSRLVPQASRLVLGSTDTSFLRHDHEHGTFSGTITNRELMMKRDRSQY
jgi:hypothetical protein